MWSVSDSKNKDAVAEDYESHGLLELVFKISLLKNRKS